MPPDQILRHAFEVCGDFAAARRLLETTPVARPAIYTLVGASARERCVIERTETGFVSRDDDTCAANDWVPCRPGWEGRIGMRRFLRSSFADAAGYSRARRESLAAWNGSLAASRFDWVREPVLNPYTRLAVAMCPARGILRVAGYDAVPGADLPAPVTQNPCVRIAGAGGINARIQHFTAKAKQTRNCAADHIGSAARGLCSLAESPGYGASHEHDERYAYRGAFASPAAMERGSSAVDRVAPTCAFPTGAVVARRPRIVGHGAHPHGCPQRGQQTVLGTLSRGIRRRAGWPLLQRSRLRAAYV
jgi:hypothetical protein